MPRMIETAVAMPITMAATTAMRVIVVETERLRVEACAMSVAPLLAAAIS